ncbi:MAG: alpha/beta fold hydrolase [Myxococcales bacterium]|nr:alpha/beta fold hydrolase [Myxococcales bacterium]
MATLRRWLGFKALVHDAVDHTTRLVEDGHESVARVVFSVLDNVEPVREPAHAVDDVRRTITSGVLASVRAVNRAVQVVTDAGIDVAARAAEIDPSEASEVPVALRSDQMKSLSWVGDAALGVLNGVMGDTLEAKDNALSLRTALRTKDRFIGSGPRNDGPIDEASVRDAVTDPTDKIVVLVHGLCATEWSFCLESERYHGAPDVNFGVLLERDLGFTAIFARYNSGRHVSTNGRALAEAIEALVKAWPVPVSQVVLVGHSMGGLVSRSASTIADREGFSWRTKLTHVASLGTPHHGAPLEKVGNVLTAALLAVDWPATRIPGKILQSRSAGIKDLRFGNVLDEDWEGRDPDAILRDTRADREGFALLEGVSYCFVSATVTEDPEHPMGRIIGDLLVRVPSAEAVSEREKTFAIETKRFGAIMHHELQNHPDVYAQLRAFLQDARAA